MFKKVFLQPLVAAVLLVALVLPALAAQKNVGLADFNGTWQMDAEKSKPLTNAAVGKLTELSGFKFTVNAKAKTIKMEWPGHDSKMRKVTKATANGQELDCQLEGYNATMLMEKISANEVRVKDRDETLVFVRVK